MLTVTGSKNEISRRPVVGLDNEWFLQDVHWEQVGPLQHTVENEAFPIEIFSVIRLFSLTRLWAFHSWTKT